MMIFDVSTVIKPGASLTIQKMVTEADTAAHFGTQKLDTLIASPVYVEMMIDAATGIVDKLLPEGLVTVGTKIEISHEAPASLGMYVTVTARLQSIDGNKLFFEFDVKDDAGVTGHGKHERIVVNRDKLIEKARQRLMKKQFFKKKGA